MAVGSFTQKISLEGAEEVRRQLEQLGDAGKAALDQFNKSVTAGNAPLTQFQARLTGVGNQFKTLGQDVRTFALGLAGISTLSIAGVAAALGAAIKSFAETGTQIQRTAQGLGLTSQQFQELRGAASAAGVSSDDFAQAMARLTQRVDNEGRQQLTSLVDLIKQLDTRFGTLGGTIRKVPPTFQRLQEEVTPLAQAIQSLQREAGDVRGNLPLTGLVSQLADLASRFPEVRKQLAALGVRIPAFDTFEGLDQILRNNSESLGEFGIRLIEVDGKIQQPVSTLRQLITRISEIKDPAEQARRAINVFGRQLGPELLPLLQLGLRGVDQVVEKIRESGKISTPEEDRKAKEVKQRLEDLEKSWQRFIRGFGAATAGPATTALDAIADGFDRISQRMANGEGFFAALFGDIWQTIRQGFDLLWNEVVVGAQAAWNSIVAAFMGSAIVQQVSSDVNAIVGFFQSAADRIVGIWQRVIDAIRSAVGLSNQSTPEGGGGGGFSSGGYTGNVGTRRIAGFVHGQEYVQPAHVVRQPGVLAFMEMLRRNGGDLSSVISRFARGFSAGGFVNAISASLSSLAIPQFAGGGFVPAPAGRVGDFGFVTLDLGGRRARIVTDAESVAALRRVAIRNEILKAGR